MIIWDCVTQNSSQHCGGHQASKAWGTTRTCHSSLTMKTSLSLMNRINLCTTIQVSSSVLCTETTWFVSMVQQARLRHRKHSSWSIMESDHTATGLSPWCHWFKHILLTESLKTIRKSFSCSDLRFFNIQFSYSVRTIFFLNLLQKELSTSLLSRWSLMNSDVWTWSLLQDVTLSW